MRLLLAGLLAGVATAACVAATALAGPTFNSAGDFIVPGDTHAWPTVGITVAMQYEGDGGNTFNSVRMDPGSYADYLASGKFPVGTMLELEIRAQGTEVEPARSGSFQGKLLGYSIHVKDEKAGPGTWTFYRYSADRKTGSPIEREAACYTCHDEHAKEDTVFTQFYPILAEKKTK